MTNAPAYDTIKTQRKGKNLHTKGVTTMKTIIINGVSCTLSEKTIARYERECAEAAQEAARLAWLRDPANFDDPIYSDIYKDTYGVRPRW